MIAGVDFSTSLLVAALGFPAFLAVAWVVPRIRPAVVALIPWAAAPAVGLTLLNLLTPGPAPSFALPLLALGVRLELDGIGNAFLLLTGLLWLAAGAFARSYHADDPERDRFFAFFALTMTGNLGLAAAGETFTFYLFFALMTFSAYGLVVHRRDGAASRAGRIYIVLALVGEVALLAGIVTLGTVAGGPLPFGEPLAEVWGRLAADPVVPELPWEDAPGVRPILGPLASVSVVAALLLGGLAVKVGLVPVHLWLPLAHPIAPTAASALLSGAMVKAGILGWLRFVPYEATLPGVGVAFLVAGAVTAFYGVVAGVAQDDPKTVLAYSTVSQMGYLAIGLGTLLVAPDTAAFAVTAIVLYAFHHGIAKGTLFLSVGVVDRLPAGLLSRRGWRSLLVAGVALPALALAGAPVSTGAQAKGVLKGALAELGGAPYATLDVLLLVAAVGTTVLMARFLLTLRSRARQVERAEGSAPWGLIVPWGTLAAIGALGFLWLPLAFPPPAEVALPLVFEDLGTAVGPILLGGALAWAVLRRPGLLGSVRNIRIPEGDVVVPVEAALARFPLGAGKGLDGLGRKVAEGILRVGARVSDALDVLSARDPLLMRGILLGSALLGLAFLLTFALSG